MFYVKEKTNEIEVKVELNDENVFCHCPDCGKEISVDLSEVFANGYGDHCDRKRENRNFP